MMAEHELCEQLTYKGYKPLRPHDGFGGWEQYLWKPAEFTKMVQATMKLNGLLK